MHDLFVKDPKPLFQSYNVQAVYLFGSHALGYARPESDYDLGLFVPNKNEVDIFKLLKDIDPYVRADATLDLVPVDFVHSAPLLMFEMIKGVLLYEASPGLGALYKSRAMHRYFDDAHRRAIKYSYVRRDYAHQ